MIYNFSLYYLVKDKSTFNNNIAIELKGVKKSGGDTTLAKKTLNNLSIEELSVYLQN